jgi:hypothetical protein
MTFRTLLQSLADEAASVIAHRSLADTSETGAKAIQDQLRRQVVQQVRDFPLSERLLGVNAGMRMTIVSGSNHQQHTIVSLYLCVENHMNRSDSDNGQRSASHGHDPERDCLGQLWQGRQSHSVLGTVNQRVLFVRSVHPAIQSTTIFQNGLANLPLAQSRQRMVNNLLGTRDASNKTK